MSDIKSKMQGEEANLRAMNVMDFVEKTGNIYEALAIIGQRSRQVNMEVKHELRKKLEEFATVSETIEEVSENKEQIEISKFYERLPNPPLIATTEFLNGEIDYRYSDEEED